MSKPEVESSRTDFEVLGLGLEASSPRKLACPRLEDSTIFWKVKILWSGWKIFWKGFFRGDRLRNFCEDLFFFFFLEIAWKIFVKTFFFFFFGEHLRFVSLVLGLGLEHSCPWPRECLSSERLSLALASDFFCVLGLGLGLEPCVLDSTSGQNTDFKVTRATPFLGVRCFRGCTRQLEPLDDPDPPAYGRRGIPGLLSRQQRSFLELTWQIDQEVGYVHQVRHQSKRRLPKCFGRFFLRPHVSCKLAWGLPEQCSLEKLCKQRYHMRYENCPPVVFKPASFGLPIHCSSSLVRVER